MPTLRTRASKGSALTHAELDANFRRTVRQVVTTATGLISDNNGVIEGNHASTPFTITLGDAATMIAAENGSYVITITNVNAAAVTVARAGADTIDGAATSLILTQNDSITLQAISAGTGYQSIGRINGAIEPSTVTASDTTDSTSGSTGSINTAGGIGAVKDIVTDATVKALGDTAAGDLAAMGRTATEGLILTGQGSTGDVTIKNDADAIVMQVPTGTTNAEFGGNIISDTDSTDDFGTTGVRWRELFVDTITATNLTPVVQTVNTTDSAVATTAATTPLQDDSIPLISEGAEFMTRTITPLNTNNILKIEVVVNIAQSDSTADVTIALHQDAVTNALAAVVGTTVVTNRLEGPKTFTHYMTAGTTSLITFRVRMGSDAANTITFNGVSGGRIYGGVMESSITVTEYKV